MLLEYLVVSYSDNMLDYLAFNWYFWFVMGTACAVAVAGKAESPERVRDGNTAPKRAGRIASKDVLAAKG